MCGIAGIFRPDGRALPPETREHLIRMTDALVHRGPDGAGHWLCGPIGLGHRRLSIIDRRGGAQPMTSHDGRYTISYNGEIYTYRELRKELEARGARFTTLSDTEVIIESVRLFGVSALTHLEGMFAFALWDAKERTLLLARDRFGKKPLFYTLQNNACYFASELSALTALPVLSLHIDQAAIIRYLAHEYVPEPQTVYKEAKSLLPAHYAYVTQSGVTMERYWDLPEPKKAAKADDCIAECRSLLTQAVRRRLISDVPLGVFLSGGIDSSLVTALMAHEIGRVKTFSIAFTEASYDESRYARAIAERYATDHHETVLSADQCADILPSVIEAMDVPMADASLSATYLLARATRRHVTVALGGDGADELWAGYENYPAYALGRLYRRFPRSIRLGLIEPIARKLPSLSGYVNPRRALATFLHAAYTPDWLGIQDLLTAHHAEDLPNLLSRELATGYNWLLKEEFLFAATKLEYEAWQNASPLARAFHVYCRSYLPYDILVKVDRASMLNSLEVRAPFLDTDFAEFTARLPLEFKCRGLTGKRLLRKACADLLPPRILNRNKRGFQIPVADWLRGRLKPLAEDLFETSRLQQEGFLNAKYVHALMERHVSGAADLRKELWTLLVLQLWLRAQAKKPAVRSPTDTL